MKNKKENQADEYLYRIAGEVKINNVTFSKVPSSPAYRESQKKFIEKETNGFFEQLKKTSKKEYEESNFYHSELNYLKYKIALISEYVAKIKAEALNTLRQNNSHSFGATPHRDFIYLRSYELFLDWLTEKKNSLIIITDNNNKIAEIDKGQPSYKNGEKRTCLKLYNNLKALDVCFIHIFLNIPINGENLIQVAKDSGFDHAPTMPKSIMDRYRKYDKKQNRDDYFRASEIPRTDSAKRAALERIISNLEQHTNSTALDKATNTLSEFNNNLNTHPFSNAVKHTS